MSKQVLHDRIENDFTLHPPTDPAIGDRMDTLREVAKSLGHTLVDLCPESRELSLALTHLDDALKEGISAIARNQARVLDEFKNPSHVATG